MSRIVPIAEVQGPYAVRYTWSGTAPYDVWLNGERVVNQGAEAEFVAQRPGGGVYYAIEVRDAASTGEPESAMYSPRLRLQWRGNVDTSVYLVQRYSGSEWVTQQIVVEGGEGYYVYFTPGEADGDTVQWRVVSEDEAGNQGTVAAHSEVMVCTPAPPDVVGSYAAGTGLLTIAAAA